MEQVDSKEDKSSLNKALIAIKIIIAIGMVLVLLISFYGGPVSFSSLNQQIGRLGFCVLLAGAGFAAGGLLGFIFGIPSLMQNPNDVSKPASSLKYNDNLIQISDWLTKIIVGVGLVELRNVPGYVRKIAWHLGSNINETKWGENAALVIIVYFVCFGFLIIYFWTRTDFTKIIIDTDLGIKAREIAIKEAINNTMKELNSNKYASTSDSVDILMKNVEFIPEGDMVDLQNRVKRELSERPVRVDDDLQKNRWGGKSENKGFVMTANVMRSKLSGFFDIEIEIFKNDGTFLREPVAVFVHDTFSFVDNVLYVVPNESNKASVTLVGYEAFTVGALFKDGTTLELDLNQQKGYPSDFYWLAK